MMLKIYANILISPLNVSDFSCGFWCCFNLKKNRLNSIHLRLIYLFRSKSRLRSEKKKNIFNRPTFTFRPSAVVSSNSVFNLKEISVVFIVVIVLIFHWSSFTAISRVGFAMLAIFLITNPTPSIYQEEYFR